MQSPAFFFFCNRQGPVLTPYVDNASLTALTRESSDKVFTALVAELRLKEFVLRDEIVASQKIMRLECLETPLSPLRAFPALSVLEEIFPWSLQHLGRMASLEQPPAESGRNCVLF